MRSSNLGKESLSMNSQRTASAKSKAAGSPAKWGDSRWGDLMLALEKPESYCQPSRRDKLKDWWFENHPRIPTYDFDVYSWHMDRSGQEDEYVYLFSLFDVPFYRSDSTYRLLTEAYSEHPITVVRNRR